ncbi:MAG: MFS transporter [Myxococcales bacterium]
MSEESSVAAAAPEQRPNPLKEITQPFVDLVRAPRALWGVNLSYLIEGLVYFGWLTLMALSFNKNLGLDDHKADLMVGFLTGGITLSMLFFGGVSDKWGVRRAMIVALLAMLVGRIVLVGAGIFLPVGQGLWSPMFYTACVGLLGVILGYGLYQPAAYSAVRQFCDERSSAMAYAMLYALMNLGGFLPGLLSPAVRNYYERAALGGVDPSTVNKPGGPVMAQETLEAAARTGMNAVLWVYVGLTVVGIILLAVILSNKTQKDAIEAVKKYNEAKKQKEPAKEGEADKAEAPAAAATQLTLWQRILKWIREHPFMDPKFSFFIFCLIPVQTLFAHNWLTLPQYVDRALGKVGHDYMEFFVNLNPILIFVLTPTVAALTRKANVYRMMILGTLVMAAPTFLLAIPGLAPSIWLLLAYLVISSIGEAMWQPRFLQYAAEIAPPGRTGAYMGVAQFPWFLTKVITSTYAGWFLMKYCPEPGKGTQDTTTMWLFYAFIAMASTVMLILAKGWLGKDFKTKAA